KSKNEDYDPMIMTPSQRHKTLNNIHEDSVKFSKTETGHAIGAAVIVGATAGGVGGAAFSYGAAKAM
ncbi:MAG: hypothetical protein ACI4PK_00925, partial [Oscillospiraceae bacterium]